MKVLPVSLNTFKSQNKQMQDNKGVNPYVYTATSSYGEQAFKPKTFNVILGALATLAVATTLYKLSGKKIFKLK